MVKKYKKADQKYAAEVFRKFGVVPVERDLSHLQSFLNRFDEEVVLGGSYRTTLSNGTGDKMVNPNAELE